MRIPIISLIALAGISSVGVCGEDSLPLDSGNVSKIQFQYAYGDTSQVVVYDSSQVHAVMATLQLEPAKACECAHSMAVVFTVDKVCHRASVCSHCFDLSGRYKGHWVMPVKFYAFIEAYRDSNGLRQPWDGRPEFGD